MAARLEKHFEDEVVEVLTAESGWTLGAAQDLDLDTGINSADLTSFIGATQPEMWERWLKPFPDVEAAQVALRQRVAHEIDQRGTIDVLGKGVRGNGCRFDLCCFEPAHGLTPLLVERYRANRLTVTRQQRYTADNNNTIDVVLWVNGLAVATVELKNPLTGQDVTDAKAQYRSDRDPKDRFLSRRAVVHFAVDPHLAFMTTRLAGDDTRFLPFNQGDGGRQGNPPAADGRHATAYLWERVWQRDAFLDLLGRFVHVEVDEAGRQTGTVIFPRYHQWDCVLALEAHAKAHGAGHRYLAQHSAGSGTARPSSRGWTATGSQEPGQAGLARPAAPDLTDDRLRGVEGDGLVDRDQCCSFAAVDRDEDARVEDHGSPRWRRISSRSSSVTGPSSDPQSAGSGFESQVAHQLDPWREGASAVTWAPAPKAHQTHLRGS